MRALLPIALAALIGGQDPADDPFKALESGDSARALAAADALVDWKGDDAALAARLDALPDGAKFYATMIRAEREALRAAPDFHKPPRRVDVTFADLEIDEAVQKCSQATGVPIHKQHWGDDDAAVKTVSVDLKNATPLEIASALASAAGAVLSIRGGAFTLERDWDGGAPPRPPVFWRNYRVAVDRVEVERSSDAERGPRRRLNVIGNLTVDPNIIEACSWKTDVTVLEAVDDKGASLVVPDEPQPEPPSEGGTYSDRPAGDAPAKSIRSCHDGGVELNFELLPPSEGATKISRLRAAVDISVPKSLCDLNVDPFKPGDYDCGPFKVTAEKIVRKSWQWILRLRVRRADGKPIDPGAMHLHVCAASGDARPANRWVNARLGAPDEAVYEVTFNDSGGFELGGVIGEPDEEIVKSLRIRAVESATFRVHVEVTDIPVTP